MRRRLVIGLVFLLAALLPATSPVPTYEVRIQGDEIQVGWS